MTAPWQPDTPGDDQEKDTGGWYEDEEHGPDGPPKVCPTCKGTGRDGYKNRCPDCLW